MKPSSRLFSLANNLDSLIAAAVGCGIILMFSKHSGIGVSPDSVTYISAARHLADSQGLRAFDDLPVVDFPAGYPVFLSLVSLITRVDPLLYGAILNALLFGLLIYLCGTMMNGFYHRSGWYKRILLACLVLSPAVLEVYSMLWSETIFLLLLIFFMIAVRKYLIGLRLKWMVISAVLVALACVVRYAGIVLVLIGGFLILFEGRLSWGVRIRRVIYFGAISISLLALNLIRNELVTSLATGERQRGTTPFFKNMEYFGDVLCDWLLLDRNPVRAVMLTSGVLCLFLLSMLWCYFRRKDRCRYEYTAAAVGFFYCLFMLASATLSRYEQFTSRLLAPMFIPLVWCCSFWIPAIVDSSKRPLKILYTGLGLFIAALFLKIQLAADYETWDGVKDAGIPGYFEDPFPQSDIVRFIQHYSPEFRSGYRIYSNAGDAVYLFTGQAAHLLPQRVFPREVNQYYREKDNYLVWFNEIENPDLPDEQEIIKNKRMVLIKSFSDGAVYITPGDSLRTSP
ncbi:MAG TPA: hypothetical protein VG890_04365 [Puia sp.]|nr:hypothetical protein [Puia sp.]